jgi:lysophospholipase L1-like esterase
MKSSLTFLTVALFLAVAPLRADPVLKPGDVLGICGDSITQQKIYTAFIEDYLLMCEPVEGLRVVQFGWGGEKSGPFSQRINSDVLPFKPTVVTTFYGMNDGNYRAMDDITSKYYQKGMQQAIDELKAGGVRKIILGSPGCVGNKQATIFKTVTPVAYNQTLDALRGLAQGLAQKNGVDFVDVHTLMMDVMTKAQAAYGGNYELIPGDGVHPGPAGHLIIAYAFLKALGCDGAIGTITVDMETKQAMGTPGQKVLSFDNGAVSLESTRYPFCFQGDPDKPDHTTASVLKFFPFNDDLNRYVLVVKGLEGTKAKVTWGKETKEFPATDLAKGINLAAEFLTNPFSDQFRKVDAAVQTQQALETTMVQQFFHSLPGLKTILPGDADSLDKVMADGLKEDQDLFDAARNLVIPIQHTIQIDPEP